MDPQALQGWEGLRELCRILRGPGGCSWDRAQTAATLTPYVLEETHEVLEAVTAGDDQRLKEEIGDLLFLLLFLIAIAEEESRFTFDELAGATISKMIRRHPHVFGPAAGAIEPEQAADQWEQIKHVERARRGGGHDRLASGAAGLPALLEAYRVQEKAAGLGFDWPDTLAVLAKLDEERAELAEAMSASGGGQGTAEVHAETGDLLFTLVNLARHLRADPEQLLRRTTQRFQERFRRMEAILTAEGIDLADADLETMERAWQRGKRAES
jgi:MazG family protein